jgi:hypothetical protein
MRCFLVGPEDNWEIVIPRSPEISCVLAYDVLERPIEPLYHPIALGMVGSDVEPADPEELAHILHNTGEQVGFPVQQQSYWQTAVGADG